MGANKAVVDAAYAAFARGDIAGVLDLVDDSVEWSSPAALPHGGQFKGKDGVGQFFQGIGANWSTLELDIEHVGEIGATDVIGVLRADGSRRDGRSATYGVAHVFTVRNGKIARFREYTDLDAVLD